MFVKHIQDAFRALIRKADPLKVHPAVAENAYLKQGGVVQAVDIESVASAASVLESSLVMSEDLAEIAPISMILTKKELNSFVCYMRQLDTAYREQGKFIGRHIKMTGPRPGNIGADFEFKTTEEAAEVSPERYAQLTGQASR